jgi:hypothetical protein
MTPKPDHRSYLTAGELLAIDPEEIATWPTPVHPLDPQPTEEADAPDPDFPEAPAGAHRIEVEFDNPVTAPPFTPPASPRRAYPSVSKPAVDDKRTMTEPPKKEGE